MSRNTKPPPPPPVGVPTFPSPTAGTCPKGHHLPRAKKWGQCSPVQCADYDLAGNPVPQTLNATLARKVAKEASAIINSELKSDDPLNRDAAKAGASEESMKVALSLGKRAARMKHFKVPTGLTGDEAEAWAKKRATELLPIAVAELEYQLTLGTDAQRAEAAKDVLDMNGMRKKDVSTGGGATIILNLGQKDLPWAERVIEAAGVKSEKK